MPARLAVGALWLAYVASLFVAVAPQQAIQEVVKFGLYALAFIVASEFVRLTETARQRTVAGAKARAGVVVAAGVAVALWASGALMGLVSLAGAVGLVPLDVTDGSRLYTVLGYPNSAGSLAAAAFLVGLAVRARWSAAGRLATALTAAGQWVLLVTVIVTMSRGAWLVLPVALALTLWLWP